MEDLPQPVSPSGGAGTPGAAPPRPRRKRLPLLVLLAAVAAGAVWGFPRAKYAWTHVSTDDAVVNSHVTYLSARIDGVAEEVLVDDNAFVEKGTLLVKLDRQPFQIALQQRHAALSAAQVGVDQEVAALAVARAELEQVRSQARAEIAALHGSWYLLASIEDLVRYEVAALQSAVANLKQQQANLVFAQQEYDRAQISPGEVYSQEVIDQRTSALQVAHEQVAVAQAAIQQTRALLGLGPDQQNPGAIPDNLAQNLSGWKYAFAQTQRELAQFGPAASSLGQIEIKPGIWEQLGDRLAAVGEDALIEQMPVVATARAKVEQALAALGGSAFDPHKPYNHPAVVEAQKAVEQAQLQLDYTQVAAPISGFVSSRAVNPGTHVQPGQTLLTIRPLNDVWIDANFKETQLASLRIGLRVEIFVDAYPEHVFQGRISGFSPGTGAMMSLLPPENATGNYVKVVQRLPVRIELTQPNPPQTPLFAGLSVVPEVDPSAPPTGIGAGQRLAAPSPVPGNAAGPAQ